MVLPLKGGEQKEVCGGKAIVPLAKKGQLRETEFPKHGQDVRRQSGGGTCSLSILCE